MTEDSKILCPVCGDHGHVSVLRLSRAPLLCHVRYESADDAAEAPIGEIDLVACDCGMIYNRAFDPQKIAYEVEYDNALHCSAHFRRYAEDLVASLCRRYGLNGKSVVEIGCGDGYFLQLLCENGGNRGCGFDPSAYPRKATTENVRYIQGYFSSLALKEPPALICCRHVLEHLPQPGALLQEIRQACAESQGIVYIEVPDASYTIERDGIWDLLYEHCSYFTAESLRQLLQREGFEVLRLESSYQGQFLQAEAIASSNGRRLQHSAEFSDREGRLQTFAARFSASLRQWRARLKSLIDENRRIAVWGAGTKGVMFLNNLDCKEMVNFVVDINPEKQGCFISGTGHRIVAPSQLKSEPPDALIVMNPTYVDEISRDLASLGLRPQLLVA